MATYYNEHDPKAAAWLRELIKAGLIPPGDVDERDIQEVRPHELTRYTQQHFFAGIGGWAYALRLARWPDARRVRTGSCPCQPFSDAGNRLGSSDERHLWPVFRDLIAFGAPTVTFGEQVASPLGRDWLAGIRADLEGLGYEVGAADLCAAGVAAPHRRQRLYWMANPDRKRLTEWAKLDGGAFESGQQAPQRHDALRRGSIARMGDASSAGGGRNAGAVSCPEGKGAGEGGESWRRGDEPFDAGSASRLGHSDGDGRKQARCDAPGDPSADRARAPADWLGDARAAAWARAVPELGRDGKWRRVEPGIPPLAARIPQRVAHLRGSGNAIVPQLAALFIEACADILKP